MMGKNGSQLTQCRHSIQSSLLGSMADFVVIFRRAVTTDPNTGIWGFRAGASG